MNLFRYFTLRCTLNAGRGRQLDQRLSNFRRSCHRSRISPAPATPTPTPNPTCFGAELSKEGDGQYIYERQHVESDARIPEAPRGDGRDHGTYHNIPRHVKARMRMRQVPSSKRPRVVINPDEGATPHFLTSPPVVLLGIEGFAEPNRLTAHIRIHFAALCFVSTDSQGKVHNPTGEGVRATSSEVQRKALRLQERQSGKQGVAKGCCDA